MKKLICILILIYVTNSYAQTDILNITIANRPKTNFNFDLKFTINSPEEISPGILIELPEGIKVVPVDISIDGKKFWLKNNSKIPEHNNIAFWYLTANGIVILFNSDQTLKNRTLEINCTAFLLNKELSGNSLVKIRKIEIVNENTTITNQIFIQEKLPVFKN